MVKSHHFNFRGTCSCNIFMLCVSGTRVCVCVVYVIPIYNKTIPTAWTQVICLRRMFSVTGDNIRGTIIVFRRLSRAGPNDIIFKINTDFKNLRVLNTLSSIHIYSQWHRGGFGWFPPSLTNQIFCYWFQLN